MDVLWSSWRYQYIKGGESKKQSADSSCVFCFLLSDQSRRDEEKFILHRADFNFVVLNIYPYISGHLMIVPFAHVGEMDAAQKSTTDEMMDLAKRCQTALRNVYQPDGFNLGMNLGKAAGAGVAEHIHLHAMPRWFGDSNFMSAVSQTRVIPEDLQTTYEKLRSQFDLL